jgi:hypothetical protein
MTENRGSRAREKLKEWLFGNKPAGYKQQQNFVNNNRCVMMKKAEQNAAADNRRNTTKNQNTQFSTDIHHTIPK